LFIESRRHTMLSDDQLAPIVQDFYAYVLDRENRSRLRLGAIPEEARLKAPARAGDSEGDGREARKDLSRHKNCVK
jgi:hypothetical protein